jgi:hypothetical protein
MFVIRERLYAHPVFSDLLWYISIHEMNYLDKEDHK